MAEEDVRLVTITVDGEEFEVNALEWEDPNEAMLYELERTEAGHTTSLFNAVRLMGIDPDGWRRSKVLRVFDAIKESTEMDLGKSAGSAKSSEPTQKK